MTYRIFLRRAAQDGLDTIAGADFQRVAVVISSLAETPRPRGVKKLAGSDLWRIRVGRYRIVYAIDDGAGLVTVVRVARRNEGTYRGV